MQTKHVMRSTKRKEFDMTDNISTILNTHDNNTENILRALTDAGADPRQVMNDHVKAFMQNLARNLIAIDARHIGVSSYVEDSK